MARSSPESDQGGVKEAAGGSSRSADHYSRGSMEFQRWDIYQYKITFGVDCTTPDGADNFDLPAPITCVRLRRFDRDGLIRFACVNSDCMDQAEFADVMNVLRKTSGDTFPHSVPPELTENVRDFWMCRYNRGNEAKFFSGRELARSSRDAVSV